MLFLLLLILLKFEYLDLSKPFDLTADYGHKYNGTAPVSVSGSNGTEESEYRYHKRVMVVNI